VQEENIVIQEEIISLKEIIAEKEFLYDELFQRYQKQQMHNELLEVKCENLYQVIQRQTVSNDE